MSLRRRTATIGGVTALAVALLACSAFSSSDDSGQVPAEGGAPNVTSDASVLDGAVSDASSSGSPPPSDAGLENLLSNGDFELPCAAGWRSINGDVSQETTTVPHGGSRACRVCRTTGDVSFNISQLVTPFVPGKTYVGEAFVRAPSVAADAAASTSIKAGFVVLNGNNILDTQLSAGPALSTSNWQPVGGIIRADADGGAELVFVVQATDGCFVIDDARVYEMP